MTVRVRLAPSPTGVPHVGSAYMSLFNMILARKHGGQFIMRIEDTDQKRSRPEYETCIFDALRWAGITWDEGPDVGGPYGPYRQSERTEIYRKYCQELLDRGRAYKCFATPEELDEMRQTAAARGLKGGYDRRYRNLSPEEVAEREASGQPYVVRLKIPLSGECVFEDAIRGKIVVPWADVDDQVLMKSDNFPTYHLAAIVDDHLMKITHVIRGDEWLTSTPKHVYLYEAFGWQAPIFMHMPLLLGKDGRKLSKRRNPISILYYRDAGYLPEAFCNFLTLMGYSMQDGREMYTIDEIVAEFDPKRIGISGAIFDVDKLDWLNQQYLIKSVPQEKLWDRLREWGFNDAFMQRLMPLCHSRIKTFGEFMEVADFLFINHLHYSDALFFVEGLTKTQASYVLQAIIWELDAREDWGSKGMNEASRAVAAALGIHYKKQVIPLLFAAIQGKRHGLPLFDSVGLLGQDRTRTRLMLSIEFLGGLSGKKQEALKKAYEKKTAHLFLQENP
jgi:glutamyl-tRNA synthetase